MNKLYPFQEVAVNKLINRPNTNHATTQMMKKTMQRRSSASKASWVLTRTLFGSTKPLRRYAGYTSQIFRQIKP